MPKSVVLLETAEGEPRRLGVRHTRVGQVILVSLYTSERAQVVRIEVQGPGQRPHAYARKIV